MVIFKVPHSSNISNILRLLKKKYYLRIRILSTYLHTYDDYNSIIPIIEI